MIAKDAKRVKAAEETLWRSMRSDYAHGLLDALDCLWFDPFWKAVEAAWPGEGMDSDSGTHSEENSNGSDAGEEVHYLSDSMVQQ